MGGHTFGGDWTDNKLNCLREYLTAYRKIFVQNKWARRYRTWYVDAFAGTGSRSVVDTTSPRGTLFEESYEDPDSQGYRDGSPRIALGLDSPFDRYLFVEKSKTRLMQLKRDIEQNYPRLLSRCEFCPGDANSEIRKWVGIRNWNKERAVVFLDPYGMQVEWETIKVLAATRAVDLWYLFPLGVGVVRLLTRSGEIDEEWKKRLDLLFGTEQWRNRFYEVHTSSNLFGRQEELVRDASEQRIKEFAEERLATCFAEVAKGGLILRNSRSSPLYLLCFAAANEHSAKTAVKIAQWILGHSTNKRR